MCIRNNTPYVTRSILDRGGPTLLGGGDHPKTPHPITPPHHPKIRNIILVGWGVKVKI